MALLPGGPHLGSRSCRFGTCIHYYYSSPQKWWKMRRRGGTVKNQRERWGVRPLVLYMWYHVVVCFASKADKACSLPYVWTESCRCSACVAKCCEIWLCSAIGLLTPSASRMSSRSFGFCQPMQDCCCCCCCCCWDFVAPRFACPVQTLTISILMLVDACPVVPHGIAWVRSRLFAAFQVSRRGKQRTTPGSRAQPIITFHEALFLFLGLGTGLLGSIRR